MPSPEVSGSELRLDEVGRATMPFGAHLLQSVFSPIYRVAGHNLVPWAFSADTVITDISGFVIADAPGAELAKRSAGVMHHANLMHRDGDTLAYLERWDGPPDRAFEGLSDLVLAAVVADLPPDRLIWEIDLVHLEALEPALEQARRLGVSICLRLGGDHPASQPAHPGGIPADLVRLDANQDSRAARSAALLHLAVARFKAQGSAVLVGKVGTSGQLAAALEAGADHVDGAVFGPPVLAGRRAGWRPVDARTLAAGSSNVIVMRR